MLFRFIHFPFRIPLEAGFEEPDEVSEGGGYHRKTYVQDDMFVIHIEGSWNL